MVLSIFWAGTFAGQFLQENTIIGQALVMPSESINATLQVNDISRPISIALHFDPQSANITLRQTLIDPSRRIINTNQFSRDFFITFRVNSVGDFTLMILNQGSNPVNVDGIFGYIPLVGANNQVNLSPLSAIIIGVILFIIGISRARGIVFAIIDRRRENRRPPPLTR